MEGKEDKTTLHPHQTRGKSSGTEEKSFKRMAPSNSSQVGRVRQLILECFEML
ncbi:hypothetical protein QJS10_CPB19g00356 [Acorus calamus]|uniref:Uncharacterized protein n=1 Tax=Acorus calamus TaxID=4465 RepID=A0AAV9CFZ1_ACOCL|nr:hypothetical protein QJS10_CPB19g00356 [Acorus calamus]